MKWKSLSGVLCDKRISTKLKGKVFKVAVRPAMTYSAEFVQSLKDGDRREKSQRLS
jgi:hypothetical protein